jgi:Tfp pilus assembly protein PilN
MLRDLVGGLFVALIALVIGWRWYASERAVQEGQAAQITALSEQVSKLAGDNAQLKTSLAKVQDEEARLARDNDALRKALEQAKLTGRLPATLPTLPYPPK